MGSYDLTHRPRRLRTSPVMRDMVAETVVSPSDLILPVFVRENASENTPIASMPGVVQHTLDSLVAEAKRARDAGIAGVMLFGVPESKDAVGSGALDPDGILNVGLRAVRDAVGDDLLVMGDLCLDEFTDHGHCGVLDDAGRVDNDATLDVYAQMAVAQAQAGAHVLGPSGMMDGQIGVIRAALDLSGHDDVAVMAYSAKYASAAYGPFREAVQSSLQGDRATYQQDPRNRTESLREAMLDEEQGADILMVKPALPYLDVLSDVAAAATVPVAAYQVSGEMAMIEAAAANGWIDRERMIRESLTCIKRAGASIILTYYALTI
ncbi:porphobilinogen synthase [Dermacoccus nishinomiyaensis]|uniref:porphobilinogen synthase n=1 Tax=Dermacoccus nishinomiyaensis TaxID=1274 RepID=UPI001EF44D59|nr:porphobilinogen synthase [Dermacoccus nishinomiyaensis]MCG7428893.1 porphobilinogen synthase [Dermacoccus nishinomiyaensis]